MRVGAVRAPRAGREPEPQRALLAEADGQGTARLPVQQAVAVDLGVVLHEVPGSPGAEGLLVGDGGQRQPPFQVLADPVEVGEGEDRGRRARFHVRHAASVDFPVGDRPAPRSMCPPLVRLVGGEHVDVAVEDEVTARPSALERAHDVRHRGLRRDHPEGQGARFEKARDVRRGECRVARRVRTLGANEVAQKGDDRLAILVDPLGELSLHVVHDGSSFREIAAEHTPRAT